MAILRKNSSLYVDYEKLEENCLVERNQAHEVYNTKVIQYEDFTDYVIYDYTVMKKKSGIIEHEQLKEIEKNIEIKQIEEKEHKKSEPAKMVETDSQKIAKNNLLKSSRLLYQYAEANASDFKTFITLTFKENIQDVNEANKKFNIWRTKFKSELNKLGYDLKYLGVPEFQKRGAVHYHLLLNIPIECPLFIEQENKKECYDVKYWSYGFSSVFDIEHKTDEKFNVVKYIAKYFFKDMDERLYCHKKILKSNNLKKPNIEYFNRKIEVKFDEKYNVIDYMDNYADIIAQFDIVKYNKYNNMKIIRVWNHF